MVWARSQTLARCLLVAEQFHMTRFEAMKLARLSLVSALLACLWAHCVWAADVYRLGVEDVVRVTVYGHPELSVVARIGENGSITFPAVGQVGFSGLTAKEAELKLVKLLKGMAIVNDPQVGVLVEQYESKRVVVLGEVAKPGTYAITRGSTVSDLISQAGGLSEDAGDAAIVTGKASGTEQRMVVDLPALLEGRSGVSEPRVGDGDRIYIPRADLFYVYGEVNRPGSYRLERGMTVMQALSVAGGLTDKGTERGMRIRRKTQDGGEQVMPAQLTGKMQPNDVLQVKESLF